MTSEKQIRANRENAKKSTGPRTAEGKARASGNAIKHGLTAKDRVVLNQESTQQFEAMRMCLLEEMQIGSAVEKLLLEDIAAAAWRLRRIARIEKEMMEEDLLGGGDEAGDGSGVTLGARLSKRFAGDNAYSRLSRYEGRIRREMNRMLQQLHVMRRQDRIENAEMWRRRRSVTGSGVEADRLVRGPDKSMYHNEEAVAHGSGFRDGEETYEYYHVAATDEYAQAQADYSRRMEYERGEPHGVAAPVDGRDAVASGEPAQDQTGRRVSPPPAPAEPRGSGR